MTHRDGDEPTGTTVTGVAVFDGTALLPGRYDVSFSATEITAVEPAGRTAPTGTVVDGSGATLLPGLIDAHVHFRSAEQLGALARFGVTTALDMGTWPPSYVAQLRADRSGADMRSSGTPLAGAAGAHTHIPGFPGDSLISDPDQARRMVAVRVAEGADYLKLILEPPGAGGLDADTAKAAVAAAHENGLRVVAHAPHTGAVDLGIETGVDILTHVPLDATIGPDAARAVTVVVPTLTMMRGIATNRGVPYEHARDSVTALHRAGATIVAGTDANDAPGVPASVPHGSSLHEELELLVEAGLSPAEALRAATGAAAGAFGLADRGRIGPGLRADLLLVAGDPTTDIAATRAITHVWRVR